MMPSTRLAFVALLALAACGEKADDVTSETAADATAPHEAEFAGDVDAAIRDAAADTQAAAREAGVALDSAAEAAAESEDERP